MRLGPAHYRNRVHFCEADRASCLRRSLFCGRVGPRAARNFHLKLCNLLTCFSKVLVQDRFSKIVRNLIMNTYFCSQNVDDFPCDFLFAPGIHSNAADKRTFSFLLHKAFHRISSSFERSCSLLSASSDSFLFRSASSILLISDVMGIAASSAKTGLGFLTSVCRVGRVCGMYWPNLPLNKTNCCGSAEFMIHHKSAAILS